VSPPDRPARGGNTRAVHPVSRPAWYALERGGWRDYVTLLHPPYTAWHLSYVVIGGCLAPAAAWERLEPVVAWGRLGAAVAAFALAVGVGAHALDELNGRPLRTKIPDRVLVALAGASIGGACAIGVVGALTFEAWLALLIPLGLFLVLAYNLELAGGRFHSDLWFGLAWGGFPVLCGYAAVAGDIRGVTVLAAAFAVLLSLAQRALSNHVRYVRRRVVAVRGELELADASREPLDARRLTAAAETGLRLLSLATVMLAATLVALRI
jgi:heme O synthase-like polyprenyltransferase